MTSKVGSVDTLTDSLIVVAYRKIVTVKSLFMFNCIASENEPNYYYCHSNSEADYKVFITGIFEADAGLGSEL
ncbi:hypothetical protein EZV61_06490 [Corallincola luteus]|uniref:Uncharacterized protein n=1 Tax=Corallincola luteus TaxID=1775177 RepID=A0ABY2AQX6_9GAMM|nr:hypothetical protein [Corallincola luteus]TCI05575.1 hypothetical protein EZV61_06490 [Corallincola luteus]